MCFTPAAVREKTAATLLAPAGSLSLPAWRGVSLHIPSYPGPFPKSVSETFGKAFVPWATAVIRGTFAVPRISQRQGCRAVGS